MKQHIRSFALAIGLAAGATALVTAAPAEGRGRHHQEMKAAFDKNNDGVLDDAERAAMKAAFEAKRAARMKEALARWDANKDGTLSDAERQKMRHDRLVERFRAMDANGDGQISFSEFETAKAKLGRGHKF